MNKNSTLGRTAWNTNMSRPINTIQRQENVQDLRKRIAQGEGTSEKLNNSNGLPYFIFGLTPFTDDYVI